MYVPATEPDGTRMKGEMDSKTVVQLDQTILLCSGLAHVTTEQKLKLTPQSVLSFSSTCMRQRLLSRFLPRLCVVSFVPHTDDANGKHGAILNVHPTRVCVPQVNQVQQRRKNQRQHP